MATIHTMKELFVSEDHRTGKRKMRGRPEKGEDPPPPVTSFRIQFDIMSLSEDKEMYLGFMGIRYHHLHKS